MKIDWFKLYKINKKFKYSREDVRKNIKLDKPYINFLKKYVEPDSKILECGSGPARTAISMAKEGFKVTAIDNNRQMLRLGRKNTRIANVKIEFILGDFFNVKEIFKKDEFDCITHQGVLEHFNEEKIKEIISTQIEIARYLLFSVPLKTEFNKKYFKDDIYRNLWDKEKWLRTLSSFNILETKNIKQRTDNLIILIKRK